MSLAALVLAATQVVATADPALVLPAPAPPAPADSAVVLPNDNRRPAGVLRDGVLTLQLEAREGTWYPEGPGRHPLRVAAWAEPGRPLQNPGPLVRVPAGTEVRATLRNTLARPLTVFGLGARRGRADSVVLAPGAARDVRFRADAPGTYWYTAHSTLTRFGRRADDTQLNGAIVVDPVGAPRAAIVDDRVFLMSLWFTIDSTSPTGLGRATMAINGLSWPHTERQDLVQGDSVRWRVLNLTGLDHPMHLHGFYFRVDARGDGAADTAYAPAQRRLAVTEILRPRHTMEMVWAPARPGNWIFHCHFVGHISHVASLDTDRGVFRPTGGPTRDGGAHGAHGAHAGAQPHMFGLVLGIRVAPRGPQAPDTRAARPIRLVVREKPEVYGTRPGYAFVLGGTPAEADPEAMPLPGPPLVLTRGERVAVTIVNRATDRAAVHWHGIELESYADGVPDWSGHGAHILPSVAPGDSITVRFTPPRAGTFMYHSHFNEDHQINSGLYGPILVLEPGERWDPETDRVLLFSSAGPTTNVIRGPWAPTLLNGKAQPPPLELRAGTRYRLRLINITSDVNTIVRLLDGERPVAWRPVAKDGADLPASQRGERPAVLFFDPGEIYDFEYTPAAGQTLTLRFGPPDAPPEFGLPKTVTVPVRVR